MKKNLLLVLAGGALMFGQAPDNTKTNQRDREGGITADDQKMSKEERELAQKIRKSIVEDKTLSTYAHNVKIFVQGKKVTLKGPVRSAAEKETVEQKAIAMAGEKNVLSQLDIAPEKK